MYDRRHRTEACGHIKVHAFNTRAQLLIILLLALVVAPVHALELEQRNSGSQEFTDARLILIPKQSVLLQTTPTIAIAPGEDSYVVGHAPPNVTESQISISLDPEIKGVSIAGWSLAIPQRSNSIRTPHHQRRELTVRFRAKDAQKVTVHIAYLIPGLTWSGSSRCELHSNDQAILYSTLTFQNSTLLDFSHVTIYKPERQFDGSPLLNAPLTKLLGDATIASSSTQTILVGSWPLSVAQRRIQVSRSAPDDRQYQPPNSPPHQFLQGFRVNIARILMLEAEQETSLDSVVLLSDRVGFSGDHSNRFTHAEADRWEKSDRGYAFFIPTTEVACSHQVVSQDSIFDGHVVDLSIKIVVTNNTNKPRELIVDEVILPASSFKVLDASQPYVITDEGQIQFRVSMQPREHKEIVYKTHYTWD